MAGLGVIGAEIEQGFQFRHGRFQIVALVMERGKKIACGYVLGIRIDGGSKLLQRGALIGKGVVATRPK